jgi:organic radical activating enzyme
VKVVEIFRSIEGEGALMGKAVVFIRLYGCNMRCAWCDSVYSFEGKYEEIAIDEIVSKAALLGGAIFSVTGGEPFIHNELGALCDALLKLWKKVKIETNGSLWREIDKNVYIVASPKPPKYAINFNIALRANELKFVVDESLNLKTLLKKPFRAAYDRGVTTILQLESNKKTSLKRALALQDELLSFGVVSRVLPQLHKLLELP